MSATTHTVTITDQAGTSGTITVPMDGTDVLDAIEAMFTEAPADARDGIAAACAELAQKIVRCEPTQELEAFLALDITVERVQPSEGNTVAKLIWDLDHAEHDPRGAWLTPVRLVNARGESIDTAAEGLWPTTEEDSGGSDVEIAAILAAEGWTVTDRTDAETWTCTR